MPDVAPPAGHPAPVHLDTDVGTNPDDMAALVLLLGAPGGRVAGVTTVDDADGRRAACAERVLALAGRGDVEVTAGRDGADRGDHGGGAHRRPDPGAAAEAVRRSIRRGATVVAVGPMTTLSALERRRPGTLAGARVVAMAGWTGPLGAGLPGWGPERDTNACRDPDAARTVAATAGELTLVTLAATVRAPLRQVHLPRLLGSGGLGRLLARELTAWGRRTGTADLAAAHPGLPSDLVAFLHDAVTCAVALGRPGVTTVRRRLRVLPGPGLQLVEDPRGREVLTVADVVPDAVVRDWLAAVARADRWARTTGRGR